MCEGSFRIRSFPNGLIEKPIDHLLASLLPVYLVTLSIDPEVNTCEEGGNFWMKVSNENVIHFLFLLNEFELFTLFLIDYLFGLKSFQVSRKD